jgi:hypothetical protein
MPRKLAFEVMNVAADFGTLGSKGGYDVRFGHGRNPETKEGCVKCIGSVDSRRIIVRWLRLSVGES